MEVIYTFRHACSGKPFIRHASSTPSAVVHLAGGAGVDDDVDCRPFLLEEVVAAN